LYSYHMKIVIKQYKVDEFVKSTLTLFPKIRKEKGNVSQYVCKDTEKENLYIVVGEWKTKKAMDKHFNSQNYELLIGAARVLGDSFEMNFSEMTETVGFELAKDQIKSQKWIYLL
jgi:quinol monooxygenase YgiN